MISCLPIRIQWELSTHANIYHDLNYGENRVIYLFIPHRVSSGLWKIVDVGRDLQLKLNRSVPICR